MTAVKKSIPLIFLIILLGSVSILAQEECTDIIYLSDGQSMIFKCCIDEIKDGNIVHYTKERKSDTVTAMAVDVDGKYIDLSRFLRQGNADTTNMPASELSTNNSYRYYSTQYNGASKQKLTGTYLTFSGAFLGVTGYILLNNNSSESYKEPLGAILFVVGNLALNIGIPLWISGAVKARNNRNAMEEIQKMNLSLKATGNGIGLVLEL